jgi:dihydroorotase
MSEAIPIVIINTRLPDAPNKNASVSIKNGIIDNINTIQDIENIDKFNASNMLLLPGIIDLGVFAIDKPAFHFGGITRAALMPDQPRILDDPALVERSAKAGKPDFWVHPLAAATQSLAGAEIAELGLMQTSGAKAIATGRARIANSRLMLNILLYAKSLGLVVISHAEDESLTAGAVATAGLNATLLGLPSAPSCAEAIAVARDIALVRQTKARLHFRQVTTRAGFELVRAAKSEGLPVTCGITPAHVFLSETAIGNYRTFSKISPPLRCEDDRIAALEAIEDGTIDVLCSGHDPRGPEDKRLPFAEAKHGMAGAESLLPLALNLVRDGFADYSRIVALLCTNPAKILGVNAGCLAPGYEADLILVDPDAPWQISTDKMAAYAGNTPFDGLPVQGRVFNMWKGGQRIR